MRRILPVLAAAALLLPLAALSDEQPAPPKAHEPAGEPPAHPSASEAIDKAKEAATAAIEAAKEAVIKAIDKAKQHADAASARAHEAIDAHRFGPLRRFGEQAHDKRQRHSGDHRAAQALHRASTDQHGL